MRAKCINSSCSIAKRREGDSVRQRMGTLTTNEHPKSAHHLILVSKLNAYPELVVTLQLRVAVGQ